MPSILTISTTKSVTTTSNKSGPPSAKLGKSRSEMTSNKTLHRLNKFDNDTILSSMRRKSTSSKLSSPQPQKSPAHIWRAPGHCEIPDILGNAYLEPLPVEPSKKSISINEITGPKRPPWIPAGSNWTPAPLPPVIRTEETTFEKRLKKALPKIIFVSLPKSRYTGSEEIGTGVNGPVIQVQVKNGTGNQASKLALKRCKLDKDKDYRAAIVRELRIMASGHHNLIKLKEVSIYKNEVWIAMDLMKCSVFTVLCARGLPEEYAIYIARETLNGLSFLHSKGYIHRDVKCENLLVGYNGEIKLADFGLATTVKHINRERLGTAKWMAPEVIRETSYNEKVDLWSLGITLIEMMDRVPPHYNIKTDEEVFQKILEDPSPTFTYSYPTIYCTGLVAWLLEDDSANRPSAKDVITEIDVHVEQGLLKMTTAQELSNFVTKLLKA